MNPASSSALDTSLRMLDLRQDIIDKAILIRRQRFTDLYLSRADDCGTGYGANRKIAIKRFKMCTKESKQLVGTL